MSIDWPVAERPREKLLEWTKSLFRMQVAGDLPAHGGFKRECGGPGAPFADAIWRFTYLLEEQIRACSASIWAWGHSVCAVAGGARNVPAAPGEAFAQ